MAQLDDEAYARVNIGGKEQRVSIYQEVETIQVNPMMEPDPNWEHADKAGHIHRAGDYSTVSWVQELYHCVDCNDTHDDGHYACTECGEKIIFGTRVTQSRTIVASQSITVKTWGVEPVEQDAVVLGIEGVLRPLSWNSEEEVVFMFIPKEDPNG